MSALQSEGPGGQAAGPNHTQGLKGLNMRGLEGGRMGERVTGELENRAEKELGVQVV